MRSLNLDAGETVKIKPGQTKIVPMCLDTYAMKRDPQFGEKKLLDINRRTSENEKVIINLKLRGKIS